LRAEGETVVNDTEVLIRLTPSGRRHILASRESWGWRPGLPVLVSRHDDWFRLGIPGPRTDSTVEFTSLGIRLAVLVGEVDYFQGSVLSCNYECLFEGPIWWLQSNDLGRSGCSGPLGASCCPEKFRRLHPELFGFRGRLSALLGGLSADDREQIVARTSAFLRWGDGRAAVVLRMSPLVVAAYCDEMDAAVLLGFPTFLADEHGLMEGMRLVTANLHRRSPNGRVASDLVPGPAYRGNWTNVRPLIADFLATEENLVEARRRAISEREYRRREDFGQRALADGQPVRSGRPLEAATPRRR
jgi:hypothetical protein